MVVEIKIAKARNKEIVDIVLVDDEDELFALWGWRINSSGYAYQSTQSEGKWIDKGLHRLILERKLGRSLVKGETVDHVNRNRRDNRRENLRVATLSQNQANRGKPSNNTSGYKGVTWNKESRKWRAQVRFEGKNHVIGRFDDPLEAHKAYCKKAKELHGEFWNDGTNG